MMPVTQKSQGGKAVIGGNKSQKEIVTFLDTIPKIEYSKKGIDRIKKLDALFGNISKDIDVILVGGTNGKSSTMHFASKLLQEEGYRVGVAYSSHLLNYNERLLVNSQMISNKAFTDAANEVVLAAQANKIDATSFEIMTMAALLYFKAEKIDVALFEVGLGGKFDITTILNPKVAAITRIAEDHSGILGDDLDQITFDMLELAKQGSWLISAEQSKIRLNKMKKWAEEHGVNWAMPIRKLASLPYVYEQLYGRAASLGERITQIYVEDIRKKFSPFLRGNLLATQKGQRGRPTLEAKRKAEINPIKTLKKFWNDEFSLLPGRFELLDKEKPSVLLDNADNLDALTNLFLGIRLLHYQHPIKELNIIVGLPQYVKTLDAIKLIRYLLKKVSGQILFVEIPGETCHSTQSLADVAKELGIKSQAYESFAAAFKKAKENVDDRDGLVVVTGHESLVAEYWKNRGAKKV